MTSGYCSFLVRYWPRDDGGCLLVEQIQTGDSVRVSTPREAADWIGQRAAARPSRAREAPAPTSTAAAPSADERNPGGQLIDRHDLAPDGSPRYCRRSIADYR